MRYCHNCGKELMNEMKFCENCGVKQKKVQKTMDYHNNKSMRYLITAVCVFLIAVVVGIVFFIADKKDKEEDRLKREVTGHIENVEETDIEEKNTTYKCVEIRYEWIGNPEIGYKTKVVYDKNGTISKDIIFDLEGNLRNTYVYTCDENGNVIEYTIYDNEDNPIGRAEKAYDMQGICKNFKEYSKDGNITYEENYDEQGNIISKIRYYAGKKDNWEEYTYDNNGKRTSYKSFIWSEYDGKEILSSWNTCVYNVDGTLLKEETYISENGKTRMISYTEYEYDALGNTIESRCYNFEEDGTISGKAIGCDRVEFLYDTAGNLMAEKFFGEDNTLYTWREYIYDSEGNMLSNIRYNSNGEILEKFEKVYQKFEVKKGN